MLFLPEYGVCRTGALQHLQFIEVVFLYTPSIEINLSQLEHLLFPIYIDTPGAYLWALYNLLQIPLHIVYIVLHLL